MKHMDNGTVSPLVITIGRTFGSGGRELGRKLDERLGIDFYDKKLLEEAAEHNGLSPEFFKRNDERYPQFLAGMFSFAQGYSPLTSYATGSAISSDGVYQVMSEFILKLASERPCVIVGRTADYVLRNHPSTVNVFVHAPVEACIDRVMGRGEKYNRDKARQMIEKVNKLRAGYYNFYTDKQWGHATSYDLSFDSSLLPIDHIVELIIDYVKRRGLTLPPTKNS